MVRKREITSVAPSTSSKRNMSYESRTIAPSQRSEAFLSSSPAGASPPASMNAWLPAHPPCSGSLTPGYCNEKPLGIFIGSELFTRRKVLDLLHDHFPEPSLEKSWSTPEPMVGWFIPKTRISSKGGISHSSEVKFAKEDWNFRQAFTISEWIHWFQLHHLRKGDLFSDFISNEVYPRRGDGDAPAIIWSHSQPLVGPRTAWKSAFSYPVGEIYTSSFDAQSNIALHKMTLMLSAQLYGSSLTSWSAKENRPQRCGFWA